MILLNILRTFRRPQTSRRRILSQRSQITDSQTLEARIVPATLVSPNMMTYQDFDGDDVTVTFFDPILNAGNVNTIFSFNSGNVNGSNVLPQQLRSINLSSVAAAAGTTVTTVATRNPVKGGDGFAALGQLNATGRDLGAVTIDGDLGRILAGDATAATPGITDLTVYSMGRYGTVTGAVNLNSQIKGTLGSLIVKADIKGAFVEVFGGADGRVDTLTVGGSMIGNGTANSGRVHSHGNMGKVTVGRDVVGGIGTHSGAITTFGDITSVSIGGSLIGGAGSFSGMIRTDVNGGGHMLGDFGGHIGTVTIGRDVVGGSRLGAGTIVSESGNVGNVIINGSLTGGVALQTGQVYSLFTMGNVVIGRNVVGAEGRDSGQIYAGQNMGSVTIRGSVRGGTNERTGRIEAVGDMGVVNVTGGIIGGAGKESGRIDAKSIAGVTVGGSVRGGTGERSGGIQGRGLGTIPTLRITGDVVGGAGVGSGTVGGTQLGVVTIGGSLIGGTSSYSGQVYTTVRIAYPAGSISNLTISGNIQGGSAAGSKSLVSSGVVDSSGTIDVMTVGGSLIAGMDSTTGLFERNGAIQAGDSIGSLRIRGNIAGNETNAALISARGQAIPPAASDLAIGVLAVTGFVEHAVIYAGIDRFGNTNADAQIGTVTVGGDWVASNLIAGGAAGSDGLFGTQDDVKLSGPLTRDVAGVYSRINALTIGGQVIGTEFTGDNFGIVAESVVNLSIGGNIIPMLAGRHNDFVILHPFLDGFFGDVWLREI